MKTTKLFLLGVLLAFISACASTPSMSPQTGNPKELVDRLGESLSSARANNVDVLSPGLFDKAQTAFNNAQKALSDGAKLSTISQHVGQGTENLKKAEAMAEASRTILKDTNIARAKALKVGADKLGTPYNAVDKNYLKLTKAIEQGNINYAEKNAASVQSAFHEVEIMAIKDTALGNARRTMANADSAKLQKVVPRSYAEALAALNEADAFIGQNPYAEEAIGQKAANAEFMAQRMISINDGTSKIKKMDPESVALYLEGILGHIGQAAGTGDFRDKGVDNQLKTITNAVGEIQQNEKALEKKNNAYLAQIDDLKSQLTGLTGYTREQVAAKQKLAAEREFNERFNLVQSYFNPQEAEVYKQGSQLVIRLRGIKFPVGQAILTPENFTLLGKVQKAISTFDQPAVTIEGHTDSTGSQEKNQTLSEERAKAVKAYLVANKTLPDYRVRAIGYGPDRPLAPNTTAEGRAINRRIDVLVTPAKTP